MMRLDTPVPALPESPNGGNNEIHTRIHYDFYPPDFIKDVIHGVEINDHAIKGAVTQLVYLPGAAVWFARAALAPVVIHPQLLPLLDTHKGYDIKLPSELSHDKGGIFSTISLDTGAIENITTLEHLREGVTESKRQFSISVVEALSRRLAAVSVDAFNKYIGDEFNGAFPTTRIDSHGAIHLPPEDYRVITHYADLT